MTIDGSTRSSCRTVATDPTRMTIDGGAGSPARRAQASERIARATRSVPNAVRIARYNSPVAAITAE